MEGGFSYAHYPIRVIDAATKFVVCSANGASFLTLVDICITSFQPPRLIRWCTCTSKPFAGSHVYVKSILLDTWHFTLNALQPELIPFCMCVIRFASLVISVLVRSRRFQKWSLLLPNKCCTRVGYCILPICLFVWRTNCTGSPTSHRKHIQIPTLVTA